MLSLRLHPGGLLRLEEEPEPVPAEGEALIEVAAVGLCGSDRHWLLEGGIGDARIEAPLVLGHEFSGLARTGSYAGRLVAADPTITCGQCPACGRERSNLCINQRFAGYGGTDGALRDYLSWPERLLHPLSSETEPADGALVEPLAVALHALELGGQLAGRPVGVVGCGPIGLLLVSLAIHAGAALVMATDPLAHRLAAAVERGAARLPDDAGERAEALARLTGGEGLAVVYEVAGEDAAVDAAIELAAPGGMVVLVGIPAADRTSFRASVARRKGLNLALTRRSTEATFARAVGLLGESWLSLAELTSFRFALVDAQRAFQALAAREGLKLLIEPGGVA